MPRRCALVAGSLGLVGGSLVDHLLAAGDWDVIGLARRGAAPRPGLRHLSLDLLDGAACRAAADQLADVTHVFYAARSGRPDPAEEEKVNVGMFRNLIFSLEPVARGLRHVSLVHGTKWYGSHLGPYRTPAREDDPRHPSSNWYYGQQDFIAERQRGKAWSWSTLRPHMVCGVSFDYPYNALTLLGAYGSICRELGLPLVFPGSEACFNSVSQATDVGLLSRAMIWAASEPRCANEPFNIVNADYFRWCNLWPLLAEFFGVPAGAVETAPLAERMAEKDALWEAMVARHALKPLPLRALANWKFGDFLFAAGWDDMSSTAKCRRFGFQEVVETEPMFLRILGELRALRVIP